ncbi:MAG TPA: Spy/CpxP family protein refolding chaperone [Telluria sp.]|nr:Spy/CpxP family protein refolding chaperone [Telluria sp.]
MKRVHHHILRGAAALCLLPALALAQQPPATPAQAECAMPPHGPQGHRPPPFGTRHGGPFGHLGLDEAQQDKLFALHHEQEPQLRALHRQMDKARQELASLGRSGQYSETKARALADSIGKAGAELALLHARTESRAFAILTPQQRAKLAEQPCGPEDGARHHERRARDEGRRGHESPRGR